MRTIMTENNCRAGALTSEQSAILIACAHRLDEVESQYLAEELRSVQRDLLAASPVEQHEAAPAHSDDAWVDRFATELKSKLAEARAKGRGGWETCDPVELSRMLREHVEKGDPRDVANFCLFLWALGKPISDAALPMGRRATAQPEPQVADERAALPRYTEWLHLRAHGEWSNGVPAWARDHNGRMNDTTAAIAVIEELAARASSPNAAGAEGADERAVMGRLFEVACDALGRVAQALGLDLADTRTELILDAINELKVRAEQPVIAPADALAATPAAKWRIDGEPDPHADRYDVERAALTLGMLTDDELANGAFMNYDRPMDIARSLSRDPDYHSPIVWMTAVKDRIRWLSRALEKARAHSANETGAEGLAHEVWAAAQLAPGEGIEDGTRRVAEILSRAPAQAPVAWMHKDDPRDCISDAKKRDMIEHAGAPGARLAANYSIALGKIDPAQAAEPVAIHQVRAKGSLKWQDIEPISLSMFADEERYAHRIVYAARPPPAPASARRSDDGWWDQALRERDTYEEYADDLAHAIAEYLHIDIGENSNFNNPWLKALEAIKNAAPASAPVGLTERQIADTVNTLRDVAIRFHDTQQLRERIAAVVTPLLKGDKQ
ncbi:hypothetical protein [Burkholderia cenocepacia]|uniref:hypothetical protein n=1 Tax=Burkholderia cenocepacia TaxID=95486 RepID=UPI002019A5EA|nr:hypothetical protein [Burkholderia cenocepacia]MCO1396380.1 hypothetical protein [Burkholderia cenocepacia]MCO1408954.1 hypothetical protein [Burkholderia cenocepacia]UQN92071.1 hypothetical protein L0Z06_15225 [Burkholderia cenocepacia]UQN99220.1 hypothetical protein L0Z39_17015 [Burkholderia cenocepacia]UQP50825.1 hypothetical protein L0Y99_10230 [Burkholderia cenocepacia]